jgi:hypothetical protein
LDFEKPDLTRRMRCSGARQGGSGAAASRRLSAVTNADVDRINDPVCRVEAVYVSGRKFEKKVFCFAFRRREAFRCRRSGFGPCLQGAGFPRNRAAKFPDVCDFLLRVQRFSEKYPAIYRFCSL